MANASRWRGLRVRVILLTTLVAVASVSAMAWYAGHVSASAWRRQLTPTSPATLAGIAREVATAAGPGDPNWTRAQRTLEKHASEIGKQLIVFDSTRRAVAAAPTELLRLDVTLGADGAVSWQRVVANPLVSTDSMARAIVRQRAIVGKPRMVPIRRGTGSAPAMLVEIAAPLSLDAVGDQLIVGMLRRPLLVGLGVAIVGAILVALALSARVAAPIEQLTEAARRVAAGSSERATVPERGTAEVVDLARAFNAMTAELARQESLRRGMTSDIAHELRAPLTNIRCQVESMLDGLEAVAPATLASLLEECLGLQQLIDDLQDMAYGDQGRLELSVEPLDVSVEIAAAMRPFQARADMIGTTIRLALPNDLSVYADRRRFRQIVGNLLANALAHTPNGCVTVSASAESGGIVRVEVCDNGAGISEADLPNVFERFYRADPSRARAGGGAGLGLAIVKQLVELHGGRVSIASSLGQGTTVRITFHPDLLLPSLCSVEVLDDELRDAPNPVLGLGVGTFDRVREECDHDRS